MCVSGNMALKIRVSRSDFYIQFYSHLCMLYMVLYRGWHQVIMHEVCKLGLQINRS